ncbi:MAG: carboxypeptidase regulatory-like domain-containing protein [Pirellulaceae bacterium]
MKLSNVYAACFSILAVFLTSEFVARAVAAIPDSHELEVLVVDAEGAPVPDAKVQLRPGLDLSADHVTTGEFVKGYKRFVNLRANAEGRLVVNLPETPDRLVINVTTPGFGPYWAAWNSIETPDGMPTQVTIDLETAWSVGGVIVDEEGKAVEGAEVSPGFEFRKRPGDLSQLGVGGSATTDAEGRWHYDCVPESMTEVRVSVDHPQFRPWRNSLTRDQFEVRDDHSGGQIVMDRGLVVTGQVTNANGDPVGDALVRTKFLGQLRETTTIMDGTFELSGCESAMTRIVVSAEGLAPQQRDVRLLPDMDPVDFELHPGRTITIRVLDENDQPIPKAIIFFQGWQNSDYQYFEFDYLNRYTDEHGVWQWTDAPPDEIVADICRPDGMNLASKTITAREEEYVFRPPSQLFVSGRVIDAVSGQPVEEFRVVPGLLRDNGMHNWDQGDAVDARQGRYRLRHFSQCYPAHVVKIEAEGYSPEISRNIDSGEGEVTIDFELQPAAALSAIVRTPAGDLAVDAEVVVGTAGSQINIKNGRLDITSTYNSAVTATDDDGRFRVPAQTGDFQVVILHESGFAHLRSNGELEPVTLTAWATVEGTFSSGGELQPSTSLAMFNDGISSYGESVPNIFLHYYVTTGSEGQFRFDRVYPGKASIGRHVLLTVDDGARDVISSCRVPVSLKAGETTTIELGKGGRNVFGQLQPPEAHEGELMWNFALVNLYVNIPPGMDMPEGALNFIATVDAEGNFTIENVPPGRYQLNAYFSEHSPLRAARVFVEVFDSDENEPQDIGIIRMQ